MRNKARILECETLLNRCFLFFFFPLVLSPDLNLTHSETQNWVLWCKELPEKLSSSNREIDCGAGKTEACFSTFQGNLLFIRLMTALYKGEAQGQKDSIIHPSFNSKIMRERKRHHHSRASIESRFIVSRVLWDIKSTCVRGCFKLMYLLKKVWVFW